MHSNFNDILDRILLIAKAALAQANTHAAFMDPGREYWPYISILNAAHAGELFIKAVIAKEHPLLLFKDIFIIDDNSGIYPDVKILIERGKTHDFEKLPQVLWVTTGLKIPNPESFTKVRKIRNAIQHFGVPSDEDLGEIALEFIYTNIDPLIQKAFGLWAIDFHEDQFYDYLVASIVRQQLKFSIPNDFTISEISLADELIGASTKYKNWLRSELKKINRLDLLN